MVIKDDKLEIKLKISDRLTAELNVALDNIASLLSENGMHIIRPEYLSLRSTHGGDCSSQIGEW